MKQLVSAPELQQMLAAGPLCLFDCRFNLLQPQLGRQEWLAGHIPGAVHANMDKDLAAPLYPGSGRHPLPEADAFARFLAESGWEPGMPVVAYDALTGAFAVRLWWLFRYFGLDGVALLDGGLAAWTESGFSLEPGEFKPATRVPVQLHPNLQLVLDADAVAQGLRNGEILLLDARDAERFEGKVEPIDPVAGHIPGARNRPLGSNLDAQKRFLPVNELGDAFDALLRGRPPTEVVSMCGSGVTACHNLFAMELAGLQGARIYAGSWSGWISDPARPVATGS